ncbi:hypothetical protein MtrunA17_Chr4g0026151 [Medicago truncatula]|uniref:Uncharacterized protein n=1 Tax=Medicago truncatula TaxID=3880 RepID=A0A396I4D2_MEDTR|nr:hypothetical protein MtrunA17_Chr4g0026151 [Medicago truncatula]
MFMCFYYKSYVILTHRKMLICIWPVLLRLETARFINLLKVENEKECMALSSKEVEACLWYIRFQV